MRQKISIDQLQVGMYLEGDVSESIKGSARQKVKLLAKGMLITTENQIRRLREAGLTHAIIDTSKGKAPSCSAVDVPTVPKRPLQTPAKSLPAGREVAYREELSTAQFTQKAVTRTLRKTLGQFALSGILDQRRAELCGQLIRQSILRNMDAMVGLTHIKEHDPYTAAHSINVCILTLAIAFVDGIEDDMMGRLATATLLHDIGKTKVPWKILTKPGRLEAHEMKEMQRHTTYGEEILSDLPGITEEALSIVVQHHERLDGSGYPRGLKGTDINRWGQLTAVADVYDGMTTPRTYKPTLPPSIALRQIYRDRGEKFLEEVVDLFVRCVGVYPVGSVVLLNTREVGIVCEPNPENARHPQVGIIVSRYQKPLTIPRVVSLEEGLGTDRKEIVKVLDPEKYNIDVGKTLRLLAA